MKATQHLYWPPKSSPLRSSGLGIPCSTGALGSLQGVKLRRGKQQLATWMTSMSFQTPINLKCRLPLAPAAFLALKLNIRLPADSAASPMFDTTDGP